jgi:hypothetical protein
MNVKTKDSMTEAEIQNLLDGWIQARRKVWDALFGLATANAPAPWQEFLERSVGSYDQIVESVLKVQAAGVSTALRAFGPLNAWGEGMQRLAETMVDTQRKSAQAWSEATAEMTSPMTRLSPLADASGAAKAAAEPSSRGAGTGAAKEAATPADKEAPAPSKAGQRATAAA